jgi:hypothetical protein
MGTSKGHGKYIETPERMWELFAAYVQEVKSNPRKRVVFVGKDGMQKDEPLERPLTMEGFELYVADLQVITDLSDYFENKQGRYDAYVPICSRIRKAIRRDQIEGGMVGQYNASITQRLNGLADKTQAEVKIEQPLFND